MQTNTSVEDGKITTKNKEIRSLKTQINALEEEIGDLQDKEKNLERLLNVKTAEYDREKDINSLLMQKRLCNLQDDKQATLQRNDNVKKIRDLCCHEMSKAGSCTFKKCMFSHDISDQDRNNSVKKNKAEQQLLAIEARKKSNETAKTSPLSSTANNIDVCETVFKNGAGSCTQDCPKRHELDFSRIKKGICHLYIAGECRRGTNCWFTHEVPNSIKNDNNRLLLAKDFIRSRKEKTTHEETLFKSNGQSDLHADNKDPTVNQSIHDTSSLSYRHTAKQDVTTDANHENVKHCSPGQPPIEHQKASQVSITNRSENTNHSSRQNEHQSASSMTVHPPPS